MRDRWAIACWPRAQDPVSATILLTHTHWDHIQGFPFFAPLFQPDNRFKVYGPEGAHLSLRDVLAGQMEHHYFPVELDQLAARISYARFVRRDLRNRRHAGAGAADESSFADAGISHRSGGAVHLLPVRSRALFRGHLAGRRAARKMESILDAGDRRHAEYMQGADVVIHEAQYTPQEYPSKRHWGHSTYVYVVELAALAGVRRLFLTHHDPSHDDEFIAGRGTQGPGTGAKPGFEASKSAALTKAAKVSAS